MWEFYDLDTASAVQQTVLGLIIRSSGLDEFILLVSIAPHTPSAQILIVARPSISQLPTSPQTTLWLRSPPNFI
jgi:hypothetical protein